MTWLLLILLLIGSGTVSASETALFALGRRTLQEFGHASSPLQRRVYLLMSQPRTVLLTVLITNTAINVAIFAISFLGFEDDAGAHPTVTAVRGIAVLFAVIIFGEILPKAIALRSARRFAPPAAAVVFTLQTVLSPIRWLLATFLVDPITRLLAPARGITAPVTTEELRLLLEHSTQDGHLNASENDMLQAVVGLSDVSIRSVMTPRVDVKYVTVNDDRATALRIFTETGRRRVPVCGNDLDDVRGVLYARSLFLNPDAAIRALMRRTYFIPEQANLMQLLRFFRTQHVQLAIVVDEYGGTAGLVTIDDVTKWIVGDLPDHQEIRRLAPVDRIDENTYRLSGDLSVRIWADRFAVTEVDRDVDTLGGLVLARLGRLPRVGDSVRMRNLTLTVDAIRKRRIERVLLSRDNDGVEKGASPS